MANPTVIWEHSDPNGTRGRRLTHTGATLVYEESFGKDAMGEPVWMSCSLASLPPAALDVLAARVLPKPEDEVLAEQALARAVGLSGHPRVTVLEQTVRVIADIQRAVASHVHDLAAAKKEIDGLRKTEQSAMREFSTAIGQRDDVERQNARLIVEQEKILAAHQKLIDAMKLPNASVSYVLERAAAHMAAIQDQKPLADSCEECVRLGERVGKRSEQVAKLSVDLDTARRELEAWKAKQPIERNRQLEIFVAAVYDTLASTAEDAPLRVRALNLINQRNGPLPRRKLLPKGSMRVVKAAREWLWVTPKPTTDEESALRDAVLALPPEAP